MATNKKITDTSHIETLCNNSIELINFSRHLVAKQVNLVQLLTFYSLGKWIVDEQQKGENRAQYGEQVIVRLSEVLTTQFGKGFSEDILKRARKFYITYKDRISATLFHLFAVKKRGCNKSRFFWLEVTALLFTLLIACNCSFLPPR